MDELERTVAMETGRLTDSQDGYPVPPQELHTLISGNALLDVAAYFEIGRGCMGSIQHLLSKNGIDLGSFQSVLDFGCGAGRVIRHVHSLTNASLFGCDINHELIDWCTVNLPFAKFSINSTEPPLSYPAGSFDMVYSFSVFTHLPESQQVAWFHELARVTAPDGFIIISTHGEAFAVLLNDQDRARMQSGQLIVYNPQYAGNPIDYGQCNAFHPPAFIRDYFAKQCGLQVVDHMPGTVRDLERRLIGQDVFLLRKPAYSV